MTSYSTSHATPLGRQAERVRASLQFGAVYLAAFGFVAAVAWWWSGLGLAAATDTEQAERRRKKQRGTNQLYTSVAARETDCNESVELMTTESDQTDEPSLDPAFVAAAAAMAPAARALLVHNAPPSSVSVETLLHQLGRSTPALLSMAYEAPVQQVPRLLSPRACAKLRAAVDAQRRTARDSVDGGPEHQLNLSRAALELLIGPEECAKVWRLPRQFRRHTALVLPSVAASQPVDDSGAELRRALGGADGDGGGGTGSGPERVAALKAEAVALGRAGDQAAAVERLQLARRLQRQLDTVDGDESAGGDAVASSDVNGPPGCVASGKAASLAGSDEAGEAGDAGDVGDVGEAGGAGGADGADGAGGAGGAVSELREMFVRRYSADTRPWIGFHTDAYEITVNVALSGDDDDDVTATADDAVAVAGGATRQAEGAAASNDGSGSGGVAGQGGGGGDGSSGALLGVYGGAVRAIRRCEGDATVHSSKLLHGVAATRGAGRVRYSLIAFFDRQGEASGRWAVAATARG